MNRKMNTTKFQVVNAVWLLFMSLSLVDSTNSTNTNNGNFVLNIIHVNDHHSHLEQESFTIPTDKLPNVDNKARRISVGGFPRLVRVFRDYKNTHANVLKLHAGDALVGTTFYQRFGNDPDVTMMHQVCFDAFNIGNHEFDDGDAQLADFLRKLTDTSSPCQNTRILSSNLAPGSTSPLKPLTRLGYIAPHMIRNFNGIKVGIIGVNVRGKTMSGSSPDPGTTLTNERDAVRDQVKALTIQGVDKIVVLSHLGYQHDMEWLTGIDGVDVVIGGHTHTLLGKNIDQVLNPRGTYPQFKHQRGSGKPVCIVTAWRYGHGVGQLSIEFDAKGNVVQCNGDFIIPYEPNPEATAEDQQTVVNYLQGLGHTFVRVSQNQETLSILQTYTNQIENNELFSQVVAMQAETICNNEILGVGRNTACTEQDIAFGRGGSACDLVAQAMLDQTPQAQVAIQNAGGCRSDITAGNFTFGDAVELLPYSDKLVLMNMTGEQIKTVLEQSLEQTFSKYYHGSYPHASGLRFDVNASEYTGQRISNLQINARLEQGTWNDIDMQSTYTVVTNSFLAAGHDGYQEFGGIVDKNDTNTTYLDAFLHYVEEQGSLTRPEPEYVSTQKYVAPSNHSYSTFAPGDDVDADDEEEDDVSSDEPGLLWTQTDNQDSSNDDSNNSPGAVDLVDPNMIIPAGGGGDSSSFSSTNKNLRASSSASGNRCSGGLFATAATAVSALYVLALSLN